MKRCQIALALLALLVAFGARAEVSVPIIDDLAAEARLARDRQLPLLIMFYSDDCGYCMRVEEEFLEPMIISGDYTDRVLIRRLNVGHGAVRDFGGQIVPVNEITARYEIRVTPTIVFVDTRGRELAPKMVGLTTPDFYGGYLDEAIFAALDRLRGERQPALAGEPPTNCSFC